MEQENIIQALKTQYDQDIIAYEMVDDFFTIVLKPDRIAEIIRFMYFHRDLKFQFLTSLCAVHYPDTQQIAVVYQLHNLVANVRLRVKTFLPESDAVTQTIQGGQSSTVALKGSTEEEQFHEKRAAAA